MRRALRFVPWVVVGIVATGTALFGYFVYSPAPEVPRLSGTLTRGTIAVGRLNRTYLTYVPRGLAKGAPLVVVMHGSGETGAHVRKWTGYGFDRLADEHGVALVYPDGYEVAWSFWAALSTMGALGLQYPRKMVPLPIWVLTVALPFWSTFRSMELTKVMGYGAIVDFVVIPWPYVFATYVKTPGNRWGRRAAPDAEV